MLVAPAPLKWIPWKRSIKPGQWDYCPRGQLRLRQSDAPTQTARRSRDGPSCCRRAEVNRVYSRTIFLETLPLSALRVSTIALLQRSAFA